MKENLLIITLLCTLLVACVKEDDKPDLGNGTYRIARVNVMDSHGEITNQYSYSYEGENLVKESYFYKYEGKMVELRRTEFTYSGNEITGLFYRNDFQRADTKYVFKFENGLRTEYAIHVLTLDGVYDEAHKITYRYLGGNLISCTGYFKQGGDTFLELERRILKYDYDKVIESKIEYNAPEGWEDKIKICFYYNNDKLVKRIMSVYKNDSWDESETINYLYDGEFTEAIKKRTDLVANNDSLIYRYDHNYLVEVNSPRGKTVYEYEPGRGNYSLIFDQPGEFLIEHDGVR